MKKLANITSIKKKFRRVRNVVFTVNYLKKLAQEKRDKTKSAVSPRSIEKKQSPEKSKEDSEKKQASFGIGTLMGNFFKVSQNINQGPKAKKSSFVY